MKIVLNIYKSILFGKLRPLLKENRLNEKFTKLLHPSFKIDTNDPKKFSDILLEKLRDDPKFNEDDEYIVEIKDNEINLTPANDDILEPLINIDNPAPFNDKTEYYYLLITSEHERIIHQLNTVIPSLSNPKQAKHIINTFLGQFKYFLTTAHKIIKESGYKGELPYDQAPDNQDELERINIGYIHYILKKTLIEIYLEIQTYFPSLVKGKPLTESDIYNQILGVTSPAQGTGSSSLLLNKMQVEKFIKNRKLYSFDRAISLIEQTKESILLLPSVGTFVIEIKERKNGFFTLIEQLENLIYIYEMDKDATQPELSKLTDPSFSELIIEKAKVQLIEEVEGCTFPNEKLEELLKRKEQMQFINTKVIISEDEFHDSIPRKILQWIDIQIAYWKANLSIDPKILSGHDIPKIPTSLNVPELGYLLRAMVDEGVLKPRSQKRKDLIRMASKAFSTIGTDDISVENLNNKYDVPEWDAMDKMCKIFEDLMERARKDKKKYLS